MVMANVAIAEKELELTMQCFNVTRAVDRITFPKTNLTEA
jgi:hypothetical protein